MERGPELFGRGWWKEEKSVEASRNWGRKTRSFPVGEW